MEEQEDYVMAGWPDRISVMLTLAGTQIFEYRLGGDVVVPISQDRSITLAAERRYNRLLRVDEYGWYFGNSDKYYFEELYPVINKATDRVIKCLRWKWAKNFAQT